MITIDKNVPVPPPQQEDKFKARYPWDVMEVGDSFLVENEEGKTPRQLMQRLSPGASRQNAKTGKKFTLRIVDGGVRVWRVE